MEVLSARATGLVLFHLLWNNIAIGLSDREGGGEKKEG